MTLLKNKPIINIMAQWVKQIFVRTKSHNRVAEWSFQELATIRSIQLHINISRKAAEANPCT